MFAILSATMYVGMKPLVYIYFYVYNHICLLHCQGLEMVQDIFKKNLSKRQNLILDTGAPIPFQNLLFYLWITNNRHNLKLSSFGQSTCNSNYEKGLGQCDGHIDHDKIKNMPE
jgi:hypothetical protein